MTDPEATDAHKFVMEAAEPFAIIRALPGGCYEPAAEGDADAIEAFQCPVLAFPDVLDIAAWDPRQPGAWWLRLGGASLLGDHMFQGGRKKILLVESPSGYVRNRCEAVCVINWQTVDLIDAFDRGPAIVFESDRLHRKFDATWRAQARREAVPRYRVV